jgi:ClpP class serine protease
VNLLHEIISSPWFIERRYADNHIPVVLQLFKHGLRNQNQENKRDIRESYAGNASIVLMNSGKPLVADAIDILYYQDEILEPSLFMLNMVGPVTKYNQFCGPAGTKLKSEMLKRADAHPNIFAHFLMIDSGGGSGYAARQMGQAISELQKPVFGFVDDFAASAAYWIGASCAHVAAGSNMARIGSIGTYLSIADYTEYFKKNGIEIIEVYAEASADKNQEVLKAIKGDLSGLQQLANEFNDFFLAHVEQSRQGKLKSSEWNSGKMFFAKEAQAIGLIDDIIPLEDYLVQIFDEFKPKHISK